jgi:pyruvate-formate lyase
MQLIASIGTPSPIPELPGKLPEVPSGVGWGALFASPFALTLLGKLWEERQQRVKVDVKREESQVDAVTKMLTAFSESKDRLLEQVQGQHKSLLDDVVNRHDDVLRNMEASLAMQVQVSSTMAENLRMYADMAIKRSEETAKLLAAMQSSVDRTLIESFNSHIRINQEVARSLEALKNQNIQEVEMLKQVHFRLDKHFGANLDSHDLQQR